MMFMGPVGLLILAVVVVAVVAATRGSTGAGGGSGAPRARQILDQRLATGEIDEREYRRRRAVLPEGSPAGSPDRWWLVAAGVGVVALLGLLTVLWWVGMGSGSMWTGMGAHMGGAGTTGAAGAGLATEPVADAREVEVRGGELFFTPETVEIEAGESVELVFTNTGQIFHDLSIPELDVTLAAGAGETVRGTLTVEEPGSYAFLCTVPGHADGGMRGTLIVR